MITPATSSERRRSASIVSSVWLIVPSVDRETTMTGSASLAMRSVMSSDSFTGTSAPPAPSTIHRADRSSGSNSRDGRDVDPRAREPRGQMRRDGTLEPHARSPQFVRRATAQPFDRGGVVVGLDAGLNRLPVPDRTGGSQPVHERGRGHRLADAGVGAGYEVTADHGVTSSSTAESAATNSTIVASFQPRVDGQSAVGRCRPERSAGESPGCRIRAPAGAPPRRRHGGCRR